MRCTQCGREAKITVEMPTEEATLHGCGYCAPIEMEAYAAKLGAALGAAQAVFNEIQCYSTGVSVMAEEDIAELFSRYSDAADGLLK